eukprot:5847639-Prymnesium_polylepis.1
MEVEALDQIVRGVLALGMIHVAPRAAAPRWSTGLWRPIGLRAVGWQLRVPLPAMSAAIFDGVVEELEGTQTFPIADLDVRTVAQVDENIVSAGTRWVGGSRGAGQRRD